MSLLFVVFRLADGLRVIMKLNIIINTYIYSLRILSIFILMFLIFMLAMTPFAQAIWGDKVFGFKSFRDAFMSVSMINYSKGSLNTLMETKSPWFFFFFVLYYVFAVFMMYGATVMIQKNALNNIVILNGIHGDSVLDKVDHSECDHIDVSPEDEKKMIEKALR